MSVFFIQYTVLSYLRPSACADFLSEGGGGGGGGQAEGTGGGRHADCLLVFILTCSQGCRDGSLGFDFPNKH